MDLLYEITGPRLFTVIKREIKTKIADIGTEKVDASNIVHLQDVRKLAKDLYRVIVSSISCSLIIFLYFNSG